jgi:hypothetical protein
MKSLFTAARVRSRVVDLYDDNKLPNVVRLTLEVWVVLSVLRCSFGDVRRAVIERWD